MSQPTRSYRSPLRGAQAAETRARVLRAAATCFTASGYHATTLARIATEAGVSVETVKNIAPKHELLLGAFETTFAGREGRDPLAGRDGYVLDSDRSTLEAAVDSAASANALASGLWRAFVSAASSDAAVRAVLDDLLARRHADFRLVVDALDRADLIGNSAPRDDLAASLSFLFSPEGYEQLVEQSGWTEERYRSWLRDALDRLILA
jgi:AcrR family transcriptional regulator